MSVNEHEISVLKKEKIPVSYANPKYNIKVGYDRGIEIINEGGFGDITGSSFKVPKDEIISLIDNIIKISFNENLMGLSDLKEVINNIRQYLDEEYDLLLI